MEESIYHIPALLTPTIDALITNSSGIYADATFGGGGHSRAILNRLGADGRLYGFDRDADALRNSPDDSRFTFVHSDFRFMRNFLRFYGEGRIDGILADLGVSFHHFDTAERGFSFRADAPLDMRMNQNGTLTAATVLNDYTEEDLTRILKVYGDLKQGGRIARQIVKTRENAPLLTTNDLRDAVSSLINPRQQKKELAQIFQALRIEVNDEMESLRALLRSSLDILKPGGRFAVLTYHSIEDRIVKNFFRSGTFDGEVKKDFFGRVTTPWKLVGKNPIVPGEDEIEANPRSRSAKLRVAEFIGQEQ
ncbi:MAG: 16S rRNA (cytosine(1402)-N(4))-methyltransferase RsmH [Muribaculaceae bacterium]|nr:16S rRNA (cytosine(1402)-N(4))-methyltransferase RsmH [Muribaculaceae bacterium]